MIIPNSISELKNPDYKRLLYALEMKGEQERVPFYELFIENAVVSKIMECPYSVEAEINLYYNLCHDYVNYTPDCGLLQTDCLIADDTGKNNSGGKREWLNSNEGILTSRKAFIDYPWKSAGKWCYESYDEYINHLPDGMGIVIRPLGVFENVRRLMGIVPLSYLLYDDQELVVDIFERVGEMIYNSIKATFDNVDLSRAFACIMGDDLAAGKSTIVAPAIYRKYVFPWMKRIADLVHSKGMPFGLHSCGDNELIMEDLIVDVGINARHSFQDNVISVNDFKEKYGNRICVLGGVDMHKLSTLNECEFTVYCKSVLEQCKKGGGYALGTGNSPATYIDFNNFFIMHKIGLGII